MAPTSPLLLLLAGAFLPAPVAQGGGPDLLRTHSTSLLAGLTEAGDQDLDGVPDYAFVETSTTSRLHIVSGATGLEIGSLDTGISAQPSALADVGDLDGNGLHEIALGWSGSEEVWILQDGFFLMYLWAAPSGAAGFGTDITSPGDLDGDGVPDVLVGAPFSDNGNGRVIAYSGGTGALLWELLGFEAGANLGHRLAAPGDLNGDGVPDFAVSAPASALGGPDAGRVVLTSGAVGFQTLGSFNGLSGERFGSELAAVGDLNGDGLLDLAASTLADGLTTPWVRTLSGADGSLLWAASRTPATRSGSALAGVGDWNGDGIPEAAVGAPGTAGDAGQVLFLSGADGSELYQTPLATAGSQMGDLLASPGDLNGDGIPELLAGGTTGVWAWRYSPFLLLPDGGTFSASQGGVQGLVLDFPAEAGGYSYQILFSLAGTGSTSVFGLEVPLAFDEVFLRTLFGDYGFLPFATGMTGVLDAQGDGAALLGAPGGLPAQAVGKTAALAAIASPPGLPPAYSSAPGILTIVP